MQSRRDILKMLGYGPAALYAAPFLNGCGAQLDPIGIPTYPPINTPPQLAGDPSKPWWVRGNYGPVEDEIEAFDLEVIGSIPPEINGCFLRNGPNPHADDPSFWFLGDGMLHGVEFANGQAVSYANRYIQTRSLMQQTPTLLSNFGNTSLVHHGGRVLALYEQGIPFEIQVPSLETTGTFTYNDALVSAMTAHPKVCPITGELLFFGYGIAKPHLRFYTASRSGEMIKSEEIDIPRGVMMHDFQVTENYVIFFDLPLVFELVEGTPFPMTFKSELGSRIGVMPRSGTNADVHWFDVDPCYLFHTYNAYEMGDEVVVEASRFESFWEGGFSPVMPAGMPWRWKLNRQTGGVTEGRFGDLLMDFPCIDERKQGQDYNMFYALRQVPATDDYPLHPDGILKYDRRTDTVDLWSTGYAAQPDEALFVPSTQGTLEDEGWLLSMVYDRAENRSEVVILDAQNVAQGPVARVIMPRRVPFGFHGLWVPTQV